MINAVAPQTTTAPAAANATGGTGTSVDYEAFLQLFIAEMQNQDPTNPTDSKDYLAQLATFSSVEQSIQTNEKLDLLLSVMSTNDAAALIGRTVTSIDGETTGAVASVRLVDDGLIVTLDTGEDVRIEPGVSIS